MTQPVHMITAQQAEEIAAALKNRQHPNEPLPPCPVCEERPAEIRSWVCFLAMESRAVFEACGHVVGIDWTEYLWGRS